MRRSFCAVFSHKEKFGQEHKPGSTLQPWEPIYRDEDIAGHMSKDSPEKYRICKHLEIDEEFEAFFWIAANPFPNNKPSNFASESAGERALLFDIDQNNVEGVVEDLCFRFYDNAGEQSGDKDVK